MLLDNFDQESNVECDRYINTTITNQVTGLKETVETIDFSFTAFKYTKSAAQRYFNSQFNQDISDVLIMYPDYELNVTDDIVITENIGVYKYSVETIEDVGNQGEVMLVGLKRIKEV